MERFHPICDARSRVSRNIIIRAERLARSGSVPGMDAEDIKQDLRLHLYRRDDRFDPSRGQYDTFADRVLASLTRITLEYNEKIRPQPDRENAFAGASGGGASLELSGLRKIPCKQGN